MIPVDQIDSLPILPVKPVLDSLLGEVSHDLEHFFADPEANRETLQSALAGLHRASDALRTLSLDGAIVFCGEIELLVQELSTGTLPSSPSCREAFRHALSALAHYLDGLAHGTSNAALCLFPQYQELQQARGVEMASEVDLFFPDLRVDLPPSVLAQPMENNPQVRIKTERGKYQLALLKWFRHDSPDEALLSMRSSVQAVMGCVPPNRQRAFWWVASALLDCLIHNGLPPDVNASKLLGRIDLQMKSLAGEQPADTYGNLRKMLYLVACSHMVSDTVAEVKQVYALENYLPQAGALPADKTDPVLELMQAQLETAKENWEQCTRKGFATPEFAGQLAQLVSLADQLDRNTLQYLCHQIHSIAAQAQDNDQIQRIALDMAMALLLLGSGMEHYRHLDGGFHEQVLILGQRLQEAIACTPHDENKFADLIALQCRMEARSATATLVSEIRADLQHVEQELNVFFGNRGMDQAYTVSASHQGATKPELSLEHLIKLLRQTQNGLHFLSQDKPGPLLHALQQTIKHYADGGKPPRDEIHAVLSALNTLQEYVRGLAQEHEPDAAQLESALQDMQALQQSPVTQAPDVPTPGAAAQTDAVHVLHEGDELLEVFLEEAQEVLGSMRANLEIIHLQPESREPLVSIRRSFHTLKGSGRMVGLTDLAEVAWAVERAMNKWLQGEKPASPGLLNFILDAEVAFKGWVDSLHTNGSALIEAGELVKAARQIETGAEPMPVAQPSEPIIAATASAAASAAPAEKAIPVVVPPKLIPEPELELPPVVIGAVTLSHTLFGIATEEAAQHIAALMRYLAILRESRETSSISYDFMRAAHTLAGVNRTMGFAQVAELAYALEQWLEAHMGNPATLSDAQLSLLEHTVAMLGDMSLTIRNYQEPQTQPELITQLQADINVASKQAEAPPKTAQVTPDARPPVEDRAEQDDVDMHLLPIFLEEANELFPQVGRDMRAWCRQPDDKKLGRSLQRSLHTLKGSARMAGVMRLGDLTHHMEERVVQAMSQAQHDASFQEELESYFDRIGNALEQLRSNKPGTEQPTTGADASRDTARRDMPTAMMRVRSDTVDRLVNDAGEISVTRSRIETELRAFKASLLELTDSVNRLRGQLREIEIQAEGQMQAHTSLSQDMEEKFDPLEIDRFTRFQELTRFMNESVHDVQIIQQSLLKNLNESISALSVQSHLSRELQQSLMAIRMVPFSSIGERLYRIARQTGKELNKRVNLDLRGIEVELDRSVLERMTAPFEHLLRNAIAHGLESPEQRERSGKPQIGEICLALHQEKNKVVFEFSDDGAGINLARLRQKALELGIPEINRNTSDEQVMQLIITSGLTTAAEVTKVSGRGVGMDVVRSEIAALGGRIDVSSEQGKGTHFIIHLPLTMAATQVLMVHAGQAVYAIPSSMVEQAQQIKPAALETIYREGHAEWQGMLYPLHYLPHLLGDDERIPESHPYNALLLLRSGEKRLALHVDNLIGNQEAVVKNIGPQLAHLPGIAGATVLGNGSVVLILNPVLLAQRISGIRKAAKATAAEPVHSAPVVMVVDDSLTVRKITSRLLDRAGYQVVTAKDGVDALEQLGEISPAVMLLDIEMPRMDGFELAQHLRRDPKTQHLPIIMITSRTADKHRNYAQELGVNAYLGKPYQEEELLHHIAGFVTGP